MSENNRTNGVKQATLNQVREYQMQKHQANRTKSHYQPGAVWQERFHTTNVCHGIPVTKHIPAHLQLCSDQDVALDPNNKKKS